MEDAYTFSRSEEERWNLVLPSENEVEDRNAVEVNWDISHEELGHQDENNWAVTHVGTELLCRPPHAIPARGTSLRGRENGLTYVTFTAH